MGNTSASAGGKYATSPARQLSGGGVSPDDRAALRTRFEQLAKPISTIAATDDGSGNLPPAATGSSNNNNDSSSTNTEKFVLLEDCSKLEGPRGVQVAARLYRVLDAGGDGRLDFQVGRTPCRNHNGRHRRQRWRNLYSTVTSRWTFMRLDRSCVTRPLCTAF